MEATRWASSGFAAGSYLGAGGREMKNGERPDDWPAGERAGEPLDGDSDASSSAAHPTEIDPLRRATYEADEDESTQAEVAPSDEGPAGRRPGLFVDGQLVGGRYRVVRFLDEGGMGAVYEVEDEELGGRLALKAILPELGYRANSVGRFRREIQLARRVTHANVCRVFDVGRHVVEDRDLEVLFLTMELVQGETLSDRLKRDGPLGPGEALSIVRQVASALQSAHDVGVVHRDLKASNIMLEESADGVRAVVTDFGLSRSVFEDPSQSGITASGHMVGTPAYAAPEQIAGKPPTPACDVYSLGLVLYEMLRGKLPYNDDSPFMVAIQRLQGDPLPRLSESGIAVEDRWEAAIGRCLAIDPADRFARPLDLVEALENPKVPVAPVGSRPGRDPRRWLAPALGVAALLIVGLVLILAWSQRRGESGGETAAARRVAILPTELSSGGEDYVTSEVEVAIERTLVGVPGVQPVSIDEVAPIGGGIPAVTQATAASEALVSRVEDRGGDWKVTLKRVLPDGAVQWTEDFSAPKGDARLLATAVAAHLHRGYADSRGEAGGRELEVRPDDYEAYLGWHRVLTERPPGTDWGAVADGLAAVRAGSPRFVDAYLLEARIRRYLFTRSEDVAQLESAYQLARLAQEMAPSDPRGFLAEIRAAASASDFERAQRTIDRLASEHPGEVEVQWATAHLAERQGDLAGAIDRLQQIVDRQGDWTSLMELARVEVLAGRYGEARTHLGRVLDLSPRNDLAMNKLGELELEHGDLATAIRLYEEIVAEGGDSRRTNLGLCYLLNGEYATAVQHFELVLATDPENPLRRLNLADALALAGESERAQDLYRQTVEDLEPYRDSPRWEIQLIRAQALAQLGRNDEAVAALQSDAVKNANVSQAWFTTSLVFSLVGDENSAVAFANRALESGMNLRWFELPWFDPIRPRLAG